MAGWQSSDDGRPTKRLRRCSICCTWTEVTDSGRLAAHDYVGALCAGTGTRAEPIRQPVIHYHACPSCHDDEECDAECIIELELSEIDRMRGLHRTCSACEERSAVNDQWWDQYTGVRRTLPETQKAGPVPMSRDWWGQYTGSDRNR